MFTSNVLGHLSHGFAREKEAFVFCSLCYKCLMPACSHSMVTRNSDEIQNLKAQNLKRLSVKC